MKAHDQTASASKRVVRMPWSLDAPCSVTSTRASGLAVSIAMTSTLLVCSACCRQRQFKLEGWRRAQITLACSLTKDGWQDACVASPSQQLQPFVSQGSLHSFGPRTALVQLDPLFLVSVLTRRYGNQNARQAAHLHLRHTSPKLTSIGRSLGRQHAAFSSSSFRQQTAISRTLPSLY